MVQQGIVHGATIWLFLYSKICLGHASMLDATDTNGNDTALDFGTFLEYDEDVIASTDVDIQDIGLVFEDLNEKICNLNSQIADARSALRSTVFALNQVIHSDDCDLEYEGRCFHLRFDADMSSVQATKYCKRMGWSLGTVYSEEHLNSLRKHAHSVFDGNVSTVELWIQRADQTVIEQSEQSVASGSGAVDNALDADVTSTELGKGFGTAIQISATNTDEDRVLQYPVQTSLNGVICEL